MDFEDNVNFIKNESLFENFVEIFKSFDFNSDGYFYVIEVGIF